MINVKTIAAYRNNSFFMAEQTLKTGFIIDKPSDGIQGIRTGSREPVLEMSGQSANPFLLFFYRHLTFMREPVVGKYDTKENLFLKF